MRYVNGGLHLRLDLQLFSRVTNPIVDYYYRMYVLPVLLRTNSILPLTSDCLIYRGRRGDLEFGSYRILGVYNICNKLPESIDIVAFRKMQN